jgi:hypothetical protein
LLFDEAVQLAHALGLRVADLFEGSDEVEIGTEAVSLPVLREELFGRDETRGVELSPDPPYSSWERILARRLALRAAEVRQLTIKEWGCTIDLRLDQLMERHSGSEPDRLSKEAMIRRQLEDKVRDLDTEQAPETETPTITAGKRPKRPTGTSPTEQEA